MNYLIERRWSHLMDAPDVYSNEIDPEYFQLNRPTSTASISKILDQLVGASLKKRLNATQRCALAWNEANGDRERNHTTGVFLLPPHIKGNAPRLIVYVDNHSCMTDFNTNAELYLARLANWGLALSGLEFKVSHSAKIKRKKSPKKEEQALPQLNKEELAHIDEMVAALPSELRGKVRYAMCASLRRTKI